ncbi:MAG: DUF4157 domain-containing protein [Myxococcota bacterium]|nr:DUF4157 domain-containing protein [Myxococcota bacterium]
MAPSRQRIDDSGKQYRERPPVAAARETADERTAVEAAASPIRQQLQAQYGRTEVDHAIGGHDQSPFGTFILAEWAMGTAGLGSLTDSSPEAGARVHSMLQSDAWADASAGIISRYASSPEPTHAHLAVELIRRSRGQRLPADVAARLGAALGVDISDAVIHTDAAAADAAKAVNAHAFATGKDVFFAAGQYRPGTRQGDELLAHELTHVIQDAEGRIPGASGPGLSVSTPNQSHEREAERAGREAVDRLHGAAPVAALNVEGSAVAEAVEDRATSSVDADGVVSRDAAGPAPTETPEEIIARFTNYAGLNLMEDKLGAHLLGLLPHHVDLVDRTLDAVDGANRDDVSYHVANGASDEQLKAIAAVPGGAELLMRMMRELQAGFTSDDDAVEMERLVRCASPSHERLAGEGAGQDQRVQDALAREDADLQSINDGVGDLIYDEYSVIIDAMPPGLTPEAFLTDMATDINTAVHDEMFNLLSFFERRPTSASPEVGSIYDIEIPVDQGSVVLVERTPSFFVFQTITTNGPGSGRDTGSHPECGSREFGFETLKDGSIRFYTRGASRPANRFIQATGKAPQAMGWTRLMRGISDSIEGRGGKPRPGSFESWTTHQ